LRYGGSRVYVKMLGVRRYRRRACTVAPDKITKYLLDLDHIDGGPKARFFIGGGFSPDDPGALTEALKRHFRENRPTKRKPDSLGGERLVIDAPMQVPDGRNPKVRSVWGIDEGETVARFLTAYPID
jgi:hypothetical protein